MFKIGDQIIYPMHGAAVIDSIEEKEIEGKIQQYYVIHVSTNDMKLMIPKGNLTNSKIRLVGDQTLLETVLYDFSNGEPDHFSSWKQRYDSNMKKLKSGEFLAGAQVVRDLTLQNKEKKLNSSEKQMLDNAKKMFISEISLIKGISHNQASDYINEALS
jgi:CarD family transcriptional regulator